MNKVAFVLGAGILVTLFLVISKFTEFESLPQSSRCRTKSCYFTSQFLLRNMNGTFDPCDNFYKYACGGLTEERFGTFKMLPVLNDAKLTAVLLEPVDESEPKFITMAKKIFQSCFDELNLKKRGVKPLLSHLQEFGGWPVLEGLKWSLKKLHWQTLLEKLVKYIGTEYLITVYAYRDEKNSSRNILIIGQGMHKFPATHHLLQDWDSIILQRYLEYMVESVISLGGNKILALLYMNDVLKLERKIAQLIMPKEQMTDHHKFYNKMTIRELQETVPGMNWRSFLNAFPLPRVVSEEEEVIVKIPKYLKDLTLLFNETSQRTIANFLLWQLVRNYLPLCEVERKSLSPFGLMLLQRRIPRDEYCMDKLEKCFKLGKGLVFTRKVYNKNTKPITTGLLEALKKVLYKNIHKSEWLQPTTKMEAKQKLSSLTYDIGNPPQAFDDELLDNYFKNMEIHENFYENFMSASFTTGKIFYELLDKNPDDNKWLLSLLLASDVNAGYSASDNFITILPGILSEIIVDPDRPNYVNYGFLGATLGHELIHGYDSKGRQYDYKGNLRDWWDVESAKRFKEREKCFVDQFDNYTDDITGLKINGNLTLSENIADSGGFRLAYEAYEHWLETKSKTPELLLPNINLNQKQLFWLSLANFYCLNLGAFGREHVIKSDVHSINDFRIIGAFSNIREFAADFNCTIGSSMNPDKKCFIW